MPRPPVWLGHARLLEHSPGSLSARPAETPHSPSHGVGHLKLIVAFQLELCDEGVQQGPVLSLVGVARQAKDEPLPLKLHGWGWAQPAPSHLPGQPQPARTPPQEAAAARSAAVTLQKPESAFNLAGRGWPSPASAGLHDQCKYRRYRQALPFLLESRAHSGTLGSSSAMTSQCSAHRPVYTLPPQPGP